MAPFCLCSYIHQAILTDFYFFNFRRWMLTGPETARLIIQFEEQYLHDNDPENPRNFQNHETGQASQRTFQRQVNKLTSVIRSMGNPFLDDFPELVRLDSRDCMDAEVAKTVMTLLNQLQNSKREDFVWDTYVADSLKESTRDKRRTGIRRKVSGQVKLPVNWMQFLRDSTNKTELFQFLSQKVSLFGFPTEKSLSITSGTQFYKLLSIFV